MKQLSSVSVHTKKNTQKFSIFSSLAGEKIYFLQENKNKKEFTKSKQFLKEKLSAMQRYYKVVVQQ